jgi:hypothetical protein
MLMAATFPQIPRKPTYPLHSRTPAEFPAFQPMVDEITSQPLFPRPSTVSHSCALQPPFRLTSTMLHGP